MIYKYSTYVIYYSMLQHDFNESKAFQLEYGWLQRSTEGVNFDIGSKISVDWVDLKMLTMISALKSSHILRGTDSSEICCYVATCIV